MDKAERNALIEGNLGLVGKIARQLWRPGLDVNDLFQEGTIGLLLATRKFNPAKAKFSTYSAFWIRAYMRKWIMDNHSLVMVGKTEQQRQAFWKPFDPDNPASVQLVLASNVDSLDESIGEEAGDTFGDRIPADQPTPEDLAEENDARKLAVMVLAQFRESLSPEERAIWDNRLSVSDAKDAKTLRELGDARGVSRESIRQMEICIRKRYDRYVSLSRLKNFRNIVGLPETTTPTTIAGVSVECGKCQEKSYFGVIYRGLYEVIGVNCHKCGNVHYFGRWNQWPMKIREKEGVMVMKEDREMGERIRQLRKEQGWTKIELGSKIDRSVSTVAGYESGIFPPNGEMISLLAHVFGATFEYIKHGTVPNNGDQHESLPQDKPKPVWEEASVGRDPLSGPYIVLETSMDGLIIKPTSYASIDEVNADIDNGRLIMPNFIVTRKLKFKTVLSVVEG